MKKVAFFAQNGFEEVELITPVDILKRGGVDVTIYSLEDDLMVCSSRDICIKCDIKYENQDLSNYDGIILTGGPTTDNYLNHKGLLENIKKYHNNNLGLIGAICASPKILAHLNILSDKFATSHFSEIDYLKEYKVKYVNKDVVVDKNIVTAQSMAKSLDFSLALLSILTSKENVEKVKYKIMYY